MLRQIIAQQTYMVTHISTAIILGVLDAHYLERVYKGIIPKKKLRDSAQILSTLIYTARTWYITTQYTNSTENKNQIAYSTSRMMAHVSDEIRLLYSLPSEIRKLSALTKRTVNNQPSTFFLGGYAPIAPALNLETFAPIPYFETVHLPALCDHVSREYWGHLGLGFGNYSSIKSERLHPWYLINIPEDVTEEVHFA